VAEYETYYYTYDNRYSLLFNTEPSTTYTITIAPGIADPYGNTIDDERVITYTTRAYDPDITMQVPGPVGVYNAFNASTRLFVTLRNISEIRASLYNFTLNQLAEATGPDGYRYFNDYSPSPSSLIRHWTTPVEAPLNVWRYELLNVSEVGPSGVENITCVGAPETRLRAGKQAVVGEEDPTPLRLRSDPNLNGEIINEYDPGTVVDVVSGPLCADQYWWWEVYLKDGNVQGWMAEGSPNVYFLDPVESAEDVSLDELPPLS
jgi:hypothetical protein